MIDYSIMVVCFNMWYELTEPFLTTFFRHIGEDFHYEFWFVDNGSWDETKDKFKDHILDHVTPNCVGARWHLWDSKGLDAVMPRVRNHVYPKCQGKNIILFNNDILFHKTGWLKILDEHMTPDVGMAGLDWMKQYCVPFIGGGWDCIPKKVHDEIVDRRGYFSDLGLSLVCDDVDLSGMVHKLGYNIKQISELKNKYIEHFCHTTMNAFISVTEQTHRAKADRALIDQRCEKGYYVREK